MLALLLGSTNSNEIKNRRIPIESLGEFSKSRSTVHYVERWCANELWLAFGDEEIGVIGIGFMTRRVLKDEWVGGIVVEEAWGGALWCGEGWSESRVMRIEIALETEKCHWGWKD